MMSNGSYQAPAAPHIPAAALPLAACNLAPCRPAPFQIFKLRPTGTMI
jgi:hypothetical protein